MRVAELPPELRDWAAQLLREGWGTVESVSRGRVHRADRLPAFVTLDGEGAPCGLATYSVEGAECELATRNSLAPGRGRRSRRSGPTASRSGTSSSSSAC